MRLVFLLIVIALPGCTIQESKNDATNKKIDSLLAMVQELKSEVHRLDSVKRLIGETSNKIDSNITISNKKISTTKKNIEVIHKKKDVQVVIPKPTIDTIIYRFNDSRLSVIIYPWVDERQRVEIYNPKGEVIYNVENVRLSYQVSNELKFRGDGSLEVIKSHTNPGASMYWYESLIQFDIDNEPLSMQSFRYPQNSTEDAIGDKFLWDRKNRKWIKQEIVFETISPVQ